MFQSKALFGVVLLLAVLLVTGHAAAHIGPVQGDDTSIELHIDPDDDPVVGVPQRFLFLFNASPNYAIDARQCDCSMTVTKSGAQMVFQSSITAINSYSGQSESYLFTEPGDYLLEISGRSRNNNAFKPFTNQYQIDVDDDDQETLIEKTPTSQDRLLLVAAIIIGSASFILAIREFRRNLRN